ncbi:MAG: hypothetical protein H0U71_06435 [Gammaproteobacteria bacterium]|nr:hypothetical protein [Gammaproteobacteria bacterium]
MASSTGAQIKNLRDSSHNQGKENHFLKSSSNSELSSDKKSGRKNSPYELTQRYERYSKYWSILSNVAAIVAVTSVVFNIMKKRSRWL